MKYNNQQKFAEFEQFLNINPFEIIFVSKNTAAFNIKEVNVVFFNIKYLWKNYVFLKTSFSL